MLNFKTKIRLLAPPRKNRNNLVSNFAGIYIPSLQSFSFKEYSFFMLRLKKLDSLTVFRSINLKIHNKWMHCVLYRKVLLRSYIFILLFYFYAGLIKAPEFSTNIWYWIQGFCNKWASLFSLQPLHFSFIQDNFRALFVKCDQGLLFHIYVARW